MMVFTGNHGDKIKDSAVLEHAYCLYKCGKLEEAVELAQKALVEGKHSRALKHIAAQAVGTHIA